MVRYQYMRRGGPRPADIIMVKHNESVNRTRDNNGTGMN